MFVLLLTQQITVLDAEHGKNYSVVLSEYEGYDRYTEVYRVFFDEYKDEINRGNYTLIVNADGTNDFQAVICCSQYQNECMEDPYAVSYSGKQLVIDVANYSSAIHAGTETYLHFYSYDVTMVNFQVQSVIALGAGAAALRALKNENIYGLVVRCDLTSYTVKVTDETATLCVSTLAHPKLAECTSILSGAKQYRVEEPGFYSFLTVMGSTNGIELTLTIDQTPTMLKYNQTEQVQLWRYPFCFQAFSVALPNAGTYQIVQEIINWGSRLQFGSLIVSGGIIVAQETALLQSFTTNQNQLKIYSRCTEFSFVMPWDPAVIDIMDFQILVAPDLSDLPSDVLTTLTTKIGVFDNPIADPPFVNGQWTNYSLAMEMYSEEFHTASINDQYGLHGDDCEQMGDVCQLVVDHESQIKLEDEKTYFITAVPGDKVRISKLYEMKQDLLHYDYIMPLRPKYFVIDTKDVTDKTRFIVTCDTNDVQELNVTLSKTYMLPLPEYTDVQHVSGKNLSIQLKENLRGTGNLYIRIVSKSSLPIFMQLVQETNAHVILEDYPKTIELQPAVETIVGFRVPDPVVSHKGQKVAYYDAVTFLAAIEGQIGDCEVRILHETNNQTYGTLYKDNALLSFMAKVNLLTLIENQFIHIRLKSTCLIKIDIAAAPVFLMDVDKHGYAPDASKNFIVAKEFTADVDHLMFLMAAGHTGDFTISACSHPLLFNVAALQQECQNFHVESFSLYVEFILDSRKVRDSPQFIYYTITSTNAKNGTELMADETDIVRTENDVTERTVMQPWDKTLYLYERGYEEDIFYLHLDPVSNQQVCVFFNITQGEVKCFTEGGVYTFNTSIVDNVYIEITSWNNAAEDVTFKGVFFRTLKNGTTIDAFRANKPKHFVFNRTVKGNDVLFTAVERQVIYDNTTIPDALLQKRVQLYVNQKSMANRTNYIAAQTQAGPQAITFTGAFIDDDMFLVAVYSSIDALISITASEQRNAIWVPYGYDAYTAQDTQGLSDYILDSGYSPSGALVETCSGHVDNVFMSYYNAPSQDYTFSSQVNITGSRTGQIKTYLNSSIHRQNFFMTVNASAKSSYIVRHGFSEARPMVSDPTIWVPVSGKDGILTIQVDPAAYYRLARYQVYLVGEGFHNATGCGVINGRLISETIIPKPEDLVIKIQTLVPLEDNKQYTLNVLVFDIVNGLESSVYRPIVVYKGMKPTDPGFIGYDDGMDLTWIIWVGMAVLLVVIVIVGVMFWTRRKDYKKLVQEVESDQGKRNSKRLAEEVGGLEQ